MKIIRGTTPTVKFTFKTIQVGNIRTAYLVIKRGGSAVFKKTDGNADAEENSLSFTLSQEETLSLPYGDNMTIGLDWLTVDGTRGRSNIEKLRTGDSGIEEVI